MALGRRRSIQKELFVTSDEIAKAPAHPFYSRLEAVLRAHRFDAFCEELCQPYYADGMGRPGLAPGVYFRLLMLGYFERIPSERQIAWRVADSLSLRQFTGFDLTQATPNHSTFGGGAMIANNASGIQPVISEPKSGRRKWKGKRRQQLAFYANRNNVRSEAGKGWMRKRAELVERAFTHYLDAGGMRRVWLKGHENIVKRLLMQVAGFNLGLIMRKLVGAGTPRAWRGQTGSFYAAILVILGLISHQSADLHGKGQNYRFFPDDYATFEKSRLLSLAV